MMKEIKDLVTAEYCLRQLAEECCELAQAALKMIRVLKKEATPVTEVEAVEKLIEELADVEIMQDLTKEKLLLPPEKLRVCTVVNQKTNRFHERLRGGQ